MYNPPDPINIFTVFLLTAEPAKFNNSNPPAFPSFPLLLSADDTRTSLKKPGASADSRGDLELVDAEHSLVECASEERSKSKEQEEQGDATWEL